MRCPECTAASQRPHFIFRSGCKGCAARAIARGTDFHRCRLAFKQDKAYRELLIAHGVTHEEVVREFGADKERAAACQR